MSNIFESYIAMDVFCYDIIDGWVEHRKKKSLPFSDDDFCDFLNEFSDALSYAFEDYMEDKED